MTLTEPQERYLALIRQGCTATTAAKGAGVSRIVPRRWKQRNPAFAAALEAAKADFEAWVVARVENMAENAPWRTC